jgi:hypothetical protein
MGKGLPGGRRQAGRIDYRTEPNSSVLPDRPRRARGGAAGRGRLYTHSMGMKTRMVMGVMNKMHQPSLRAIAGWQGGGGQGVQSALIMELDETGFMCEITHSDGRTVLTRIDFPEPIGGDVSAESTFVGMAKVATDALSGQMAGETERDMLNDRSAQLAKGKAMHTVALSCAAVVVEVGAELAERAPPGVVQKMRHVEGTGSSCVVCRPGLVVLLRALQVRESARERQPEGAVRLSQPQWQQQRPRAASVSVASTLEWTVLALV